MSGKTPEIEGRWPLHAQDASSTAIASARGLVAALLLAAAMAGCAPRGVPPDAGFAGVEEELAERLPQQRVAWNRGSEEDAAVQAAVLRLLGDGLSADEAVQIALLNNRDLQATYEDLGVAQAELVRAGLLSNPIFSESVPWSMHPTEGVDPGFRVVQSFLDLLMLPQRQRVAAEVLNHATATRVAYYTYQGAEQSARVLREIVAAAQVSYDLAERMEAAGNISERKLATEQAALEQAKVELADAEADAYAERERLTRLMGLWGGPAARWDILHGLPDLPPDDLPLAGLEAMAVARNLELAAARQETEALARALGEVRHYGGPNGLRVDVAYERQAGGQQLLGPTLAPGQPRPNVGGAQGAGAVAVLRQSESRLEQRAIELRSEVRAVRDRLIRLRDRAEHYQQVVVPLSQRLVALSLEEYNYMLSGPFDVLAAKQNEIATYRRYIETVRDWWIAHTELERLLGGQLIPAAASDAQLVSAPPEAPVAVTAAPAAKLFPPPPKPHRQLAAASVAAPLPPPPKPRLMLAAASTDPIFPPPPKPHANFATTLAAPPPPQIGHDHGGSS
jgi:outer membrane protein, heavy metal efflux system